MKKLLLVIALLLFVKATIKAQNFDENKWTTAEMQMKNYAKDTSAHAVVLNEYGDSKLEVILDTYNSSEQVKLVYKYHVKIKIFDASAFKHGTIEIPLYNTKESNEDITDIKGQTVYADNAGNYKTEVLNADKVFSVKENSNVSTTKFVMPGLKNGCIIEYSYTKTSPYYEDLHDWQFEGDIPKVRSEYQTHIPGFWKYNASLRGFTKLIKNTSDVERDCFASHGSKADCSHMVFEMDNVPAFVEEDYMTASKNFKSAVYFELTEVTNPYTNAHAKFTKQWSDVDYQLKRDDGFGGQIKRKDLLKDRIAPVIAEITDTLDRAKTVYAYIKKTIKWDGHYSFFTVDGIRKAIDKHTGNVGEVNLSLIAALNGAGINSEAVLLSTRENGIINKLYPVITEFNYLIVQVTIAGKTYLLDATDPLLSFGMLPLRALNDQGRVMNLNKPSYWININTDQYENRSYWLQLALQTDGKLKGTLSISSRGYAAYQARNAVKKFNSIDEYVENMDEKLPKVKITKSEVLNIDSLDLPVLETYNIEINTYDGTENSKLSFNPYIFDKITTNPFKLNERVYPVDWGMPSETKFILNMQLPEGYTIDNHPKNIALTLPNQGGSFKVLYEATDDSFTFLHTISFKKSIYQPEEYPSLKELYNQIILSEKSEMLFKKKI
jgi:hypothetical protein